MSIDAAAGDKPETISLRRRAAIEFVLDNLVWLILLVVLGGFALAIPNFYQIGIFLIILT